jgi:plasmid stabilization system protein ParE
MQIEWTRPALANLARLVEFLEERSPTAAERAKTTIGNATRQLKQFPASGRPYPDDPRLRELLIPFGHYGYSMLYRVESQVVVITNLKHQLEDRY